MNETAPGLLQSLRLADPSLAGIKAWFERETSREAGA